MLGARRRARRTAPLRMTADPENRAHRALRAPTRMARAQTRAVAAQPAPGALRVALTAAEQRAAVAVRPESTAKLWPKSNAIDKPTARRSASTRVGAASRA